MEDSGEIDLSGEFYVTFEFILFNFKFQFEINNNETYLHFILIIFN